MSGKQTWFKVTDVRAFLEQRGTTKRGPHQLTKRVLHYPYCARCGLVALRNEATRRLLARDCVTEE